MELFSETQVTTTSGLFDGMYVSYLKPVQGVDSYKAVLLLHGFPGWGNKNFDVAERLALVGYHCFLPHYVGLGHSSGVFTFEESLNSITRLIDNIQNRLGFSQISCVGHSWGGFVALNIADRITQKLLWLSPLVILPEKEKLQMIIADLFAAHPVDCAAYSPTTLYDTFKSLAATVDYPKVVKHLSNIEVRIIHGLRDTVLPIDLSKRVATEIEGADFLAIDDDHSFTINRRDLLAAIEGWFRNA